MMNRTEYHPRRPHHHGGHGLSPPTPRFEHGPNHLSASTTASPLDPPQKAEIFRQPGFKLFPNRLLELASSGLVRRRFLQNNGTHTTGYAGPNNRGNRHHGVGWPLPSTPRAISSQSSKTIPVVEWVDGDSELALLRYHQKDVSPLTFLPVLFILLSIGSIVAFMWYRRKQRDYAEFSHLKDIHDKLERASLVDKETRDAEDEKLVREIRCALVNPGAGEGIYSFRPPWPPSHSPRSSMWEEGGGRIFSSSPFIQHTKSMKGFYPRRWRPTLIRNQGSAVAEL